MLPGSSPARRLYTPSCALPAADPMPRPTSRGAPRTDPLRARGMATPYPLEAGLAVAGRAGGLCEALRGR